MKRVDLLRHLETHDCVLVREGAKHSLFQNRRNGKQTTIPRHREIDAGLARKICKKDLEIPPP